MKKHIKNIIALLLIVGVASTGFYFYERSIPDQALKPFLGEWTGTKRLLVPRVYSEQELEEYDLIGVNVTIKKDLFCITKPWENPYYKVTNISRGEFENDLISSFISGQLEKLSIFDKNPTMKRLDVYDRNDSDFPLITFFLEDEDTLVVNHGYVALYELKRTE